MHSRRKDNRSFLNHHHHQQHHIQNNGQQEPEALQVSIRSRRRRLQCPSRLDRQHEFGAVIIAAHSSRSNEILFYTLELSSVSSCWPVSSSLRSRGRFFFGFVFVGITRRDLGSRGLCAGLYYTGVLLSARKFCPVVVRRSEDLWSSSSSENEYLITTTRLNDHLVVWRLWKGLQRYVEKTCFFSPPIRPRECVFKKVTNLPFETTYLNNLPIYYFFHITSGLKIFTQYFFVILENCRFLKDRIGIARHTFSAVCLHLTISK